MAEMEKLYKFREAAALLSVQESTLRKWALLGRMSVVKCGRAVRLSESQVKSLMQVIPARQVRDGH
jgi:excisionase family DNA binding protein